MPSPFGNIILALAVAGLGTGIFVSPNNSALMGAAPRHWQGMAAGVLATARNVGMVLGVGLAGAILTTVLAQSPASALSEAIDAGFVAATVVAVLSVVTSAVRGSGSEVTRKEEPTTTYG